MALCEECGSISIVVTKPNRAEQVIALLLSRRCFLCKRCGWRALRGWTDQDLQKLKDYGLGGAALDPTLAVLDEGRPTNRKRRRRNLNGKRNELFNLAGAIPELPDAAGRPATPSKGGRRLTRKRRGRTKRRQILATVAVTALALFLAAILGLTGSCSGTGNAL